jgi:hypothetical protein
MDFHSNCFKKCFVAEHYDYRFAKVFMQVYPNIYNLYRERKRSGEDLFLLPSNRRIGQRAVILNTETGEARTWPL